MSAILALVNRSLSLDCRQTGTAFVRAVSIAAMVAVILISQLVGTRLSGLAFASWLIWLNYIGITLAGFSWFASVISEEREQRTLSLLRLTDVNSASLILGKWFPRLAVILILLAIQFPMAVLSVTMGGLTVHQLVTSYVGLVAYTLMMTSLGVLWSCVCRSSRRSSMMVFLTWLSLTSVPFLLKWWWPRGSWYSLVPTWVVNWIAEPGYAVLNAIHSMSMFRKMFWVLAVGRTESLLDAQAVGNSLIALGSLVVAWFVLEYLTKYNFEAVAARPFRLSRLIPKSLKRKKRPAKTGRCWDRALAWKEFHFAAGSWKAIATKVFLYPALALGVVSFSAGGGTSLSQMWDQIGAGALFGIGIAMLVVETTSMSARLFGAELHNGTLHELMLLPMTPRQIAYSKCCGWGLAFIPSTLMLVASGILDSDMRSQFGQMLTPVGILPIIGFLFFLHLSVYLSLYLRVGAVLVSFVICYFLAGMAYLITDALKTRGAAASTTTFWLCIGAAAATVFLHWRIGPTVARVGQSPKASG